MRKDVFFQYLSWDGNFERTCSWSFLLLCFTFPLLEYSVRQIVHSIVTLGIIFYVSGDHQELNKESRNSVTFLKNYWKGEF